MPIFSLYSISLLLHAKEMRHVYAISLSITLSRLPNTLLVQSHWDSKNENNLS